MYTFNEFDQIIDIAVGLANSRCNGVGAPAIAALMCAAGECYKRGRYVTPDTLYNTAREFPEGRHAFNGLTFADAANVWTTVQWWYNLEQADND